jgi:hypothetical protein
MTCRMFFDSAEVQRTHYRAPWHCFNLKRKVAGLPPVSEESFEDKVKALKTEKIALDHQALAAKYVHHFSSLLHQHRRGYLHAPYRIYVWKTLTQ